MNSGVNIVDCVEIVRRYIDGEEGKIAFRCTSGEEVKMLFDIVKEVVYPSVYYFLDNPYAVFGTYGFEDEIYYRIERASGGGLDWGHDHAEFYIRYGRKIVDVQDLFRPQDYGEFEVTTPDLAFLFNT